MRILFISYYFAPANAIAAVRTTKIVKYLEKNGFTVDVICGNFPVVDDILKNDIKNKKNIFYIEGFRFIERLRKYKRETSEKSQTKSWKNIVFRVFDKIVVKIFGLEKYIFAEILNSYFFYLNAKKLKIDINQYDSIISSFGPIGSLLLANSYKKKNPKLFYILDLRDPVIPEYINSKILKIFLKKIEKNTFDLLDHAVVVSEGLKDYLISKNFKKDISIITNGYDLEDLFFIDTEFLREVKIDSENKLTFCYTGNLYEGRRDISKLFLALKQLINEGKIQENKISVYYAGKDENIFLNTAKSDNIESIVKSYGFIPRKKALALQSGSDVLVLATWNTNKEKGVLTGKLFEYMMFKKPILALVSGEKNAEIENILKDLNFGFTFYNDYSNINDFKNYILFLYHEKIINNKKIIEESEKVSKYDFQNLTQKYIDLLKSYHEN